MTYKILGRPINDYGLSSKEWEELIDLWIFDEFDRMLLKRKLIDNISYKCLADEFNFGERYLEKKVANGIKELIKHIG